ncbi:unnamed protein product [Heligmosomoides polygyrus]|uniref:RNase III domain-containing protein n=1 Tax=Heligmosomoides polygyrus TaxID=6339 RepID=A0A183GFT6_HELPZ|nr:unnamed protein product [Heligmosomoides polygyrus]
MDVDLDYHCLDGSVVNAGNLVMNFAMNISLAIGVYSGSGYAVPDCHSLAEALLDLFFDLLVCRGADCGHLRKIGKLCMHKRKLNDQHEGTSSRDQIRVQCYAGLDTRHLNNNVSSNGYSSYKSNSVIRLLFGVGDCDMLGIAICDTLTAR